MGLSITDTLQLVKNGYSISEISEVNVIAASEDNNSSDIIELAKKLKFSDFKQALDIFKKVPPEGGNQNSDPDKENADDISLDDPEDTSDNNDDQESSADNVDYKALYEKEKSLREKLQLKKQSENTDNKNKEKLSDFETALSIASDVLN